MRIHLAVLVTCSAILASCGTTKVAPGCTGNGQCASGQACISGACGACTSDNQCPSAQACFSGTCTPCTSAACTATGLIVAWSGSRASVPAGWAICDGTQGTPDLSGGFLMGATAGADPGATGGAATHNHGGTTSIANLTTDSNGLAVCGVGGSGCSFLMPPQAHVHTYSHSHAIAAASHLPLFTEVLFLEKQSTSLVPPGGAIVASMSATAPPGFAFCDGNSGTPNLIATYLRAAALGAEAGTKGGAATHDHGGVAPDSTATSTYGAGNRSVSGSCGNGCAISGEYGHSHTYVHAHTLAAAANAPPFMTVAFWMASGARAFPSGVIAMWSGPLASIPQGWSLCDGTNGTPDLRSRFLVGIQPPALPGAIGGSATHDHGGITSMDPGGATSVAPNTNGPGGSSYNAMSVHSHNLGAHGHTITADTSLPPYYAIAYIQRN